MLAALLAALPAAVAAHDLWLWPVPATLQAPAEIDVRLLLGEQGQVESAYFQPAGVERLSVGAQAIALASPSAALRVAVAGDATQAIAFVSTPTLAELPADKFDAYLAEEHLDTVIAARRGRADEGPVRELYSRSLKALVGLEGRALRDCPLGLPFELSLLPSAPGTISLRASHEGKPLAGVWIDLADGRSLVLSEQVSDADGVVTFTAPRRAAVARATHMLPATQPGVAWRSWWAATTFSLSGSAGVEACP